MSHQPYEKWIFSDEALPPDQGHALESHLETCKDCQQLDSALKDFNLEVHRQPAPMPAPGFTQRCLARLADVRQQRQRQRLWIFTLSLFALASLIILSLFVLNHSQFNFFYVFGNLVANFSQLAGRINKVLSLSRSVIRSVPILIPVLFTFGVGSLSATGVLIITWFSSIIKLYQPAKEGV